MQYPRDKAVRVLTKVLSDYLPLDEAIQEVATDVVPEMRGWLQEVCSGTLRWKGRIDQILDSSSLKKKPTGWLRKILSIAVYQLIAQDRTSASRVVSETVDEIKRKEGDAPAKFANAVLRKVSDHAVKWRELPFNPKSGVKDQAQWASMPDWVWSRILKEQGADWARDFAQASLARPELWIRSRAELKTSEEVEAGAYPGAYKVKQSGKITEREGFGSGEFFVQDISSQTLVAEITAELRKRSLGSHFHALDLCAAPGGKSAGMAWSGLQVTATDLDPARMQLLRDTVQRVASNIKVIEKSEVAALPPQDLVWVDAPCTGSGILRRHPDVRWLRREKDLVGLTKIQAKLVQEGLSKVRPGGFLAYSVCSVLAEEGPGVIQSAGLTSKVVREWKLAPHLSPYGDGFWAVLIGTSS